MDYVQQYTKNRAFDAPVVFKPEIHQNKTTICVWWEQRCPIYHELLAMTYIKQTTPYRLCQKQAYQI